MLPPLKPIGHIESVFQYKNGTPRQSSVCQNAKAKLTISKTVFSNPEHSLEGLQQFSHVWVLFWFHMNNNSFTKAKVKPPRLNGKKVGVFSSRSPYRPNPVGLSLVRLESVQGSTLHLSGVDMLDGTPVLDVKPYIPQYDMPNMEAASNHPTMEKSVMCEPPDHSQETGLCDDKQESATTNTPDRLQVGSHCVVTCDEDVKSTSESHVSFHRSSDCVSDISAPETRTCCGLETNQVCFSVNESSDSDCCDKKLSVTTDLPCIDKVEACPHENLCTTRVRTDEELKPNAESDVKNCVLTELSGETRESPLSFPQLGVARWVSEPPISRLEVRFTPRALDQLCLFSHDHKEEKQRLCLLGSVEEAREALVSILQADPRSTYRRTRCLDRLYFFTLDVLHVTAWFDGPCAEILRIQPTADVNIIPRNTTALNTT